MLMYADDITEKERILTDLCCSAVRELREADGDPEVAVVMWPEDDPHPVAVAHGNMAGMVTMARAILALVAAQERPSGCRNCQDAHDEATMALKFLRANRDEGKC